MNPQRGDRLPRAFLKGSGWWRYSPLGVLLLNFPLLALWDVRATVMGIPVFPVALFGLWALLIGLVGWMADRKEP